MINGYYIIDSHCHIYPQKIAQLAVNHTDEFYNENSKRKGTVEDLITSSYKQGIDKFIVQSVATSKKQVKSINEFIAREVENNKDKFVGLGTMHPESDDLEGDFMHLKELGLKGIKIHPDIQNFKLDCPGYMKIYELASKHGLVMLMHTGDSRYDNSNPNRLIPILKEFKNLKVVGAHFGCWSLWHTAPEMLCNFDNFFVDCSSSFAYLTLEESKKILLTYGEDKVLFATDYPMWNADTEIKRVLDMNLSDRALKKIFSENAKKVFNI